MPSTRACSSHFLLAVSSNGFSANSFPQALEVSGLPVPRILCGRFLKFTPRSFAPSLVEAMCICGSDKCRNPPGKIIPLCQAIRCAEPVAATVSGKPHGARMVDEGPTLRPTFAGASVADGVTG